MARPSSASTVWRWAGFVLGLIALHVAFGASPYPPVLIPTLLRPPLELAVLLALLIFAPEPWRRPIRWLALIFLAVFVPLKLLDVGFFIAFDRPFDPVLDFYLLPAGWTLMKGTFGVLRSGIAVLGGLFVLVGLVVGLYWAIRALEGPRRQPGERRIAGGLAAVLAVLSLVPISYRVGLPGAPAVLLAADHLKTSAHSLKDVGAFRTALQAEPYAAIPDNRLLAALKGKDIVLVFVESYGRGALEDPRYAALQPRLTAIEQEIGTAGFQARSAWVRSPTHGGQSWLAHETLLSGLWIDGGSRYDLLTHSQRSTLIRDFGRAGWRTVAVMPGIAEAWPEGKYLGYDKVYGAHDLGYRGLPFNWITMPDQYTLAAFKRAELDRPNRGPVMAEITLLSSHAPFTPVPRLVDWNLIGNGEVFDEMVIGAPTPEDVWRDPKKVERAYIGSIDYSLASLSSFVRTFGDDRLVVIALGDHQPGASLTRAGGPHETPIHVFAKDPKVLQTLSGMGWASGMRPGPQARPMPMDQFRGRLIAGFTPAGRP